MHKFNGARHILKNKILDIKYATCEVLQNQTSVWKNPCKQLREPIEETTGYIRNKFKNEI